MSMCQPRFFTLKEMSVPAGLVIRTSPASLISRMIRLVFSASLK